MKWNVTGRSFKIIFMVVIIFFQAKGARALVPLRHPEQLWDAQQEEVLHVQTAKILLANYPLIRKDFPEIRSYSDEMIDRWLLRNAAFVSKEQAAQEVVNTKISTDGRSPHAYRPREYRRAHVFVADTGGLLDVKGTGSVDPHFGNERNGLATLADVIREYLYEQLVSRIFKKIGKFGTVGNYAVIDLGFEIKDSDGHRLTRAGAIVRQAHVRYHEAVLGQREREDPVVLPNKLQLEIELALRRFGVTSAITLWPGQYAVTRSVDQLNIQGAQDSSIIDYGSFRVLRHFERPLYYTYDKNGNARISDDDLALSTDSPQFVQPDPHVAVSFDMWGNTVTGGGLDNVYQWSAELAEALREGRATRADAEQHLRNFLDPVDAKFNSPKNCAQLVGSF